MLTQTRSLVLLFIPVLAAVAIGGCAARGGVLRSDIAPPDIALPSRSDSTRFAVIGDTGTNSAGQYGLAAQFVAARTVFPFQFVLMTGDNLYGSETPADYEAKFERPYKPLLDAGVKFYASLGNHDDSAQIQYKQFNMDGKRFYTFKPAANVRIFALDTTYMDPEQTEWLEKELAASKSEWKIAFFHHPPYSTGGRHGSDIRIREQLEPLFVKHGIDVVFTGHDHIYERLKPQKDITYFVSGGGGKLRRGDLGRGAIHAEGFDQGYHFMLIEIAGDVMHFQAISDDGATVDSGQIKRRIETEP